MAHGGKWKENVRKIYIVPYTPHTRTICVLSGPYTYEGPHMRMGKHKIVIKNRIMYHTCMVPGERCICVSPGHTRMTQPSEFYVTLELPYTCMGGPPYAYEKRSCKMRFLDPHTCMRWGIRVWVEGNFSRYFFLFSFFLCLAYL